jgi:hypothetical protein
MGKVITSSTVASVLVGQAPRTGQVGSMVMPASWKGRRSVMGNIDPERARSKHSLIIFGSHHIRSAEGAVTACI